MAQTISYLIQKICLLLIQTGILSCRTVRLMSFVTFVTAVTVVTNVTTVYIYDVFLYNSTTVDHSKKN